MAKVELNQILIKESEYIIIELDWSVQLILPFKKGYEFMQTWNSGVLLEGCDTDIKLKKPNKECFPFSN